VTLDVPAMIVDGTTMVPIRFVSEALGAQVGWVEAQHLVTIDTGAAQTAIVTNPPRRLHRVAIVTREVIPMTLDDSLSSVDNKKGDRFTATVDMRGSDGYGDIPPGTKIEGHIAAVHPRRGDRPAILDLSFDRIVFPDGRTAHINGTLTSLDDKYVRANQNGVLMARNNGGSDRRMVYAGYGASAGLLVGVATRKPLEDTVLGGVLGYIAGQVSQDQRRPRNITLDAGTQMGVRIDRNVTIN
jgi:hypothetical protein